METIILVIIFIFVIFSVIIRPLFIFLLSHPWITLILVAAGILASVTSKERKKNAFDRLIAENLPYIISFLFAKSGRKRDLVLNTKSVLQEHFEASTVRKIMSLLKKCNETGITDGEFNNACYNLASNLSYNARYQIFSILKQIIGNGTPDEINALNQIAVKLNLVFASSGSNYDSFYDFFRNFTGSEYSDSNSGNQNQYRSQNIDYDAYKVLGLTKDASNDEIKKAYRRLCKQYHPDKMADATDAEKAEAEKKIREIISAYDKIKQERPGL